MTSLWMLPLFVAWTVAYVLLSGRVAATLGVSTTNGEITYIEAWVPWVAVTLLWLLPLLVGTGLAISARRHDRSDGLALAALIMNGLLVLVSVGPSLLDRLLHLG